MDVSSTTGYRVVCKKRKWTDTDIDDYFSRIKARPQGCVHIDMRKCMIGQRGAQNMKDLLISCSSLRHIFMYKNGFLCQGAVTIVSALKSPLCCRLTSLNMCGNEIGDKGAAAIGDALRLTTSLLALDLNCNIITDKGASDILEGIAANHDSCLQSLSLRENRLTSSTVASVEQLLCLATHLHNVHLFGNKAISVNDVNRILARSHANKANEEDWLNVVDTDAVIVRRDTDDLKN